MLDVLPFLKTCKLITNALTPKPLPYELGGLWCFPPREIVLLHPKLQNLTLVEASIPSLNPEMLSWAQKSWFRPTSLEPPTLFCSDVSYNSFRKMLKLPQAVKKLRTKATFMDDPTRLFPNGPTRFSIDIEQEFPLHSNFPALDFHNFINCLQQLPIDPKALRADNERTESRDRETSAPFPRVSDASRSMNTRPETRRICTHCSSFSARWSLRKYQP
ncbi:hypothetical protein BDV28DRAFT_81899 [Aspergillus coremiiformis]|uniref:F-box domain-containing protein n=1 Tax=Aspergillus coremiiformis TaxID=138285 RepID=A0A5N6YT20_9EURO|nr:hypothetical protein BDV28DRAFT_81899 [Aspergillus coremiiformis]